MREHADGRVEAYSPGTGMAYTTGVRADPDGVLRQIHEALDSFEVGVTTANREFSPGQFEINLSHTEALAAADRAFLLEEIVKDVAAANGLLATFMAKPFTEHEGSSHHVHVSLWSGDDNAFATDDGSLSELASAFAGGVLAHAQGLTALASPTVNSYKRLAATESLVPAGAGLGGDNRLSYLRIPSERGRATRVEVRAADAVGEPLPRDRGNPCGRPRRDRARPRPRGARHDRPPAHARRGARRARARRRAGGGALAQARRGARRAQAARMRPLRGHRHRLGVA